MNFYNFNNYFVITGKFYTILLRDVMEFNNQQCNISTMEISFCVYRQQMK